MENGKFCQGRRFQTQRLNLKSSLRSALLLLFFFSSSSSSSAKTTIELEALELISFSSSYTPHRYFGPIWWQTYVGVTQALRHCGNDAGVANPDSSTQLLVLSLGTGRHRKGYPAEVAKRWGVINWLRYEGDTPLINSLQNASADMVDYNLSMMFKVHSENYLRIQVSRQLFICVNTCISHKCMFGGFLLLKLIQSLVFAYKLH
jgi:hypothetical protein